MRFFLVQLLAQVFSALLLKLFLLMVKAFTDTVCKGFYELRSERRPRDELHVLSAPKIKQSGQMRNNMRSCTCALGVFFAVLIAACTVQVNCGLVAILTSSLQSSSSQQALSTHEEEALASREYVTKQIRLQ